MTLFILANRNDTELDVSETAYLETGRPLRCKMVLTPSSIEFWRRLFDALDENDALFATTPTKLANALVGGTEQDWLDLLTAASAGDDTVIPMTGFWSVTQRRSQVGAEDLRVMFDGTAQGFVMS